MLQKLLYATAFCSLVFTTAKAQKYISIGPVLSFGHSAITNSDFIPDNSYNPEIKTKFHPSFTAGLGLIYAKDQHWGFGAELLYEQAGVTKENNYVWGTLIEPWLQMPYNYDQDLTVGYIRLPLRVYYFFGQYKQKIRPKVYLGPSLGYKISEKTKLTAHNQFTQDSKDQLGVKTFPAVAFNDFDLGLQVGAGVNITLGKAMWLNADLNYYQGFIDMTKNIEIPNYVNTGSNWNQNIRLQIGLLFGLGKI